MDVLLKYAILWESTREQILLRLGPKGYVPLLAVINMSLSLSKKKKEGNKKKTQVPSIRIFVELFARPYYLLRM